MKKFELGRLFVTPGALEEMTLLEIDAIELLGRHQGGDWSEMEIEDAEENVFSIENNCRILSSYKYRDIKFWVITEADRSYTTILLPSEY